MDQDRGPIDDGVFVVTGREPSPLLQMAEAALDNVPVSVVGGIESDGTPTAWTPPAAVAFLIIGLGDHGLDAPVAEMATNRSRRVGLIASHRVRSGPRPANATAHAQLSQKRQEHRRVPGLPGRDQRHQRKPVPVDELMDLRRQATSGPADTVIRRLDPQILVTRSSPL